MRCKRSDCDRHAYGGLLYDALSTPEARCVDTGSESGATKIVSAAEGNERTDQVLRRRGSCGRSGLRLSARFSGTLDCVTTEQLAG